MLQYSLAPETAWHVREELRQRFFPVFRLNIYTGFNKSARQRVILKGRAEKEKRRAEDAGVHQL